MSMSHKNNEWMNRPPTIHKPHVDPAEWNILVRAANSVALSAAQEG